MDQDRFCSQCNTAKAYTDIRCPHCGYESSHADTKTAFVLPQRNTNMHSDITQVHHSFTEPRNNQRVKNNLFFHISALLGLGLFYSFITFPVWICCFLFRWNLLWVDLVFIALFAIFFIAAGLKDKSLTIQHFFKVPFWTVLFFLIESNLSVALMPLLAKKSMLLTIFCYIALWILHALAAGFFIVLNQIAIALRKE